MKGQGGLILGLIAAIVISIFAIINVEAVRVNYLFGVAEWPLILVILVSVLMGAIIAGALSMVRIHQLRSEFKRLHVEKQNNDATLEDTPSIEKTTHTEIEKKHKN